MNHARLHLRAAQRHRVLHQAEHRALERRLLPLPGHREQERQVVEDAPALVAEDVAASEEEAEAALRR